MEIILISLTVISSVLSLLALGIGSWAIITVLAIQKSTHKIEWVPVDHEASLDDKTAPDVDNSRVEEITDDDLFTDDIDLYLDPRKKRRTTQ